MSFYDNSLREILTLKNEYAGQTGMGMEIAWRGYSGGKTGDIRVYNTAVNSTQSKMDMSASGAVGCGTGWMRFRNRTTVSFFGV